MGVHYRVRQFVGRLRGAPLGPDMQAVRAVLSAEEYALFRRMPAGDRRHALCVWRALSWPGQCPDVLGRAALLHDVGKSGAGLTLLVRSLCVVLDRSARDILRRVALNEPGTWRYPFYVYLAHGALGAERCAEAGSSPEVVALVRHHDAQDVAAIDAALGAMLQALRQADGAC